MQSEICKPPALTAQKHGTAPGKGDDLQKVSTAMLLR